jgi:hypothetical protein
MYGRFASRTTDRKQIDDSKSFYIIMTLKSRVIAVTPEVKKRFSASAFLRIQALNA